MSLSLLHCASREANEVAKVIKHGLRSSWGNIHSMIVVVIHCVAVFSSSVSANHLDSDKVTEIVENGAFIAVSVVVVGIHNCVGSLGCIVTSMAVCCERSDVVVDLESNNVSEVVHDGDWCAVVVVIDELARDLDVAAIHLFFVAQICEACEVAEVIKDGHLLTDFDDNCFSQVKLLSVNMRNMVMNRTKCLRSYLLFKEDRLRGNDRLWCSVE